MAISSSTRKAGPYLGNDATTVFPFDFKVFEAADLMVVETDDLLIERTLELGPDYSVELHPNQDEDAGGSVILAAALPDDYKLTIGSNLPLTQPLELTNAGGFYPRVINAAFDRITIIAQQLLEQIGRTLKLPFSTDFADATLPLPVANGLIGFNSSADGFTVVDPANLVSVAGYADARVQLFDGDGVTTDFVIDFNPGVLPNLDVSISGVVQVAGVDFTWSGTTVVFSAAPFDGAVIQIRYARPIAPVPNFDETLEAAQNAETYALLALQQISNFPSRSFASGIVIPEDMAYLRTAGFAEAGDGGDGTYKVVGSEPAHAGKFQSADGAWWELTDERPSPAQIGATGSGDEATVLQSWLELVAIRGKGRIDRDYFTATKLEVDAAGGEIEIEGKGAIIETSLLDASIEISNASGVLIEGYRGSSVETRTTWNALTSGERLAYKPLIRLDNCSNIVIRDMVGSGKRGGVVLDGCTDALVDNINFTGCLSTISSQASNPNNANGVSILGGTDITVRGGNISECGEGVLCMSDPYRVKVSKVRFKNIHDNATYVSSGFECSISECSAESIFNEAFKARGSRHSIIDNDAKTCGRGVVITGNGATLDAFGANGHGNIVARNRLTDISTVAIHAQAQDGGYQRDLTVVGNIVENHTGTTTNAAVILSLLRGLRFDNNTIRGSTATYAVYIVGASTMQIQGVGVNDNQISDTATGQGIRFQYCDNVQAVSNQFAGIGSSTLMEFRNSDDIQVSLTKSDNKSKRLSATAANSNTDIKFLNNGCGYTAAGNEAQIEAWGNAEQAETNVTTVTPRRVGQWALYLGNLYVATGTSATTDWKRVNNMTLSAYTVTNGTTDRTFDADAAVVTETNDVLATIIADMKAQTAA